MSNPTELLDALEKLREKSRRGDYITKAEELALSKYARRAQPEGEAPQADLRRSVQAITRLLIDREWADVPLADPDAVALFDAVDALVSANNEARAPAQHAESGKERGSIGDLAEFHILLDWYDNEASYGSINEGRNKLTEYIDKWADRRAAQLDCGQEGSE